MPSPVVESRADDRVAAAAEVARAGADCVFAPGLVRLEDIERVVAAVDVPINVLLRPGGPAVAQLAAVGVARISVGGALYQASLAAVQQAAREFARGEVAGLMEQAALGRECLEAYRS